MIKFNKFNVVGAGGEKVKVHYSLDNRVDGRKCVTLYAKDYDRRLGAIFPDAYENKTDTQSDYFDKGRACLFEDHPLYKSARKKVERFLKEAAAKRAAKVLNKHHEKYAAGFYASTGGRFAGARERVGAFEVLEVATGDWVEMDLSTTNFRDHNGRAIYL